MSVLGMFIYAFGVVLTIKADVGLAPWDVFFLAIAGKLGVSYGTVAIPINIIIFVCALLMKEKIGLATILDTVLSGLFVDFFSAVVKFETPQSYVWRYAMLIGGMVIMSFAMFLYMKAALGCGPRDSLMVGLGKRLKKIPVGVARVFLDGTVFLIGFLLDRSLAGIGTAVVAFGFGLIMDGVFALLRFEPKKVEHENVIATFKNFFSKNNAAR